MMERLFILRDGTASKNLHMFLKANAAGMAAEGRPLAVHVSEHKAKRSTRQNAAYWALLDEISGQAWVNGRQYSALIWHQFFAGLYIGWDELPDGKMVPMSTSTRTIADFSDYITKIQVYAAQQFGIETI